MTCRMSFALHQHVLEPGAAGSRKCFRGTGEERLRDSENEEDQDRRGKDRRNVEAPVPRQVLLDIAANYWSNVASKDEGDRVNSHVEASLVCEEQITDGGTAQSERDA